MKFTVERDRFAEAVAWASRSVATRPIVTHLTGILIQADQGELSLSGFDTEVSSRSVIEAEIASTGRVLVPGRLLAEIARLLPNRPVDVTLEGSRVQLVCGSSRFTVPTMSVNDFPTLPEVPEASGRITGEVFSTAVAQVAVAAARDESLPRLTAVSIELEAERMRLVATDRYRLAVRDLTIASTGAPELTALVHARTLHDAARSLAHAAEIQIGISPKSVAEQRIGFAADGKVMTSRLLDGEFPPYTNLFPEEAAAVAVVEVAPLLEAVRRVALVTDKNIPMRLHFENQTLRLEATGGEEATATEEIPISLEGDDISIAFNSTYLADGLSAVNAPFAQLAFTEPKKPSVISPRAAADGASDPSYRYLLMPMRYGV